MAAPTATADSAAELARPALVAPQPSDLPDRFAVLPFVNRSGAKGLDWMSAGVPFIIGERLESHRGLSPTYGPLVVPASLPRPASNTSVGRYARQVGAKYVVTGEVGRPKWKLQIGAVLWRVTDKGAVVAARASRIGEFKEVHPIIRDIVIELTNEAGIPVSNDDRPQVTRLAGDDFYAFTLFGRGLTALIGRAGKPNLLVAKKSLERAVYIDPKLAEAQRLLGELYRRYDSSRWADLGKRVDWLGQAMGRFERAIEVWPEYQAAMVSQAELALAAAKFNRAKELYVRAVSARPRDAESRFRLAETLLAMSRVDDAYEQLAQVVVALPDDVRIRRMLVLVHSNRGEHSELVDELRHVIRLDPADRQAQLDLGAALASAGRTDEAIAHYKTMARRAPKDAQPRKFLADLYKTTGKRRLALKYYNEAMRADPSDPRAYFLLADMHAQGGEDDKARRVYQRAQRFSRFLPEVSTNLGAIAYRAGKLEQAVWYHKRAVAGRPKRARFRYNLALSLSASNLPGEALSQLNEGLTLSPGDVEMNYLRGVVLLRLGKADQAERQFEHTLSLAPEHEGAKHNRIMLEQLRRKATEGEVPVE